MTAVQDEWFIIVNPHAGSGKTISIWNRAEELLKESGIPYICSLTDCRYHAVELACTAAEAGYRKFLAVGGDGTIHEVLGGIMKYVNEPGTDVHLHEFTLGVIPIGSGNDWIRTHKVKNDLSFVVSLISEGLTSRQDVVKVSILDPTNRKKNVVSRFAYMINVGGVGIDARICRSVNRIKERGKGGPLVYIKAFFTELFRYKMPSFEVSCDGKKLIKGACFSVALGIGKYSGGGFRQTPDAVVDDGMLDITAYEPLKKGMVVLGAPLLLGPKVTKYPHVLSARAKSVVVKPLGNNVNEPVEVDGEIIGHAPVMFQVHNEQINVVSALNHPVR